MLHPRTSNWARNFPRYNPQDAAIKAIQDRQNSATTIAAAPPPIYNVACAYSSATSVNEQAFNEEDAAELMDLLGDLESSDDELDVMGGEDDEIKKEK